MASAEAKPWAAALHERLFRWRFALFFLLIGHSLLAHYFVLGLVTWDGFGHRLPPVVELVQHGSLGHEKYLNWALISFVPFIELTNAPFLELFGMPGTLLAFPLALFPLCASAIFLFVRDITKNRDAALYATLTYALVPLVNAQLFSGCIDWAVPGLLALLLYAIGRLGAPGVPRWTTYAGISLATFVFTMSRQQAPYLGTFFFVCTLALTFVERRGWRFVVVRVPVVLAAVGSFVVGLAPAASVQIVKFVRYGAPIHPYQLNLLGIKVGAGYSIQSQPWLFGLPEYSARGLWRATVAAWLVPVTWPNFFCDGRNFGGGLFFISALVGLPLTLRAANRSTRAMLAALLAATLMGKDFWSPRFAYTLLLALCICNGLLLSTLLARPRWHRLYLALLVVLAFHAFRPEWELFRIKRGDFYTRMNVTESPWFVPGNNDVVLYPDVHAKLVIAFAPANGFALPLFGRRLTNEVLGSVAREAIGESCAGLHAYDRADRDVLVVDDENLTKDCARACAISGGGRCLAWRLTR